MKKIAITGRSGCGKSSVSAFLRGKGYRVCDADLISREVLQPPSPCLVKLQERFGADILDEGGALNRHLLANRAFATPEGTKALTDITFTEILNRVRQKGTEAEQAGESLFFVDGAVIVGTPAQPYFDAILLVETPFETSVRRICARDQVTEEEAACRLNAQTDPEVLRQAATWILRNDAGLDTLRQRMEAILPEMERL